MARSLSAPATGLQFLWSYPAAQGRVHLQSVAPPPPPFFFRKENGIGSVSFIIGNEKCRWTAYNYLGHKTALYTYSHVGVYTNSDIVEKNRARSITALNQGT